MVSNVDIYGIHLGLWFEYLDNLFDKHNLDLHLKEAFKRRFKKQLRIKNYYELTSYLYKHITDPLFDLAEENFLNFNGFSSVTVRRFLFYYSDQFFDEDGKHGYDYKYDDEFDDALFESDDCDFIFSKLEFLHILNWFIVVAATYGKVDIDTSNILYYPLLKQQYIEWCTIYCQNNQATIDEIMDDFYDAEYFIEIKNKVEAADVDYIYWIDRF